MNRINYITLLITGFVLLPLFLFLFAKQKVNVIRESDFYYNNIVTKIAKDVSEHEIKMQKELVSKLQSSKSLIDVLYENKADSFYIHEELLKLKSEIDVSTIVIFDNDGFVENSTYNIPDHMKFFSILSHNACPDYIKMQNDVEIVLFMPLNYNRIRNVVGKYVMIFSQQSKKYIQFSYEQNTIKLILEEYKKSDSNIEYISITTPNGNIVTFTGDRSIKEYDIGLDEYSEGIHSKNFHKNVVKYQSFGDVTDYCFAKHNKLTNSNGEFYHVLHVALNKNYIYKPFAIMVMYIFALYVVSLIIAYKIASIILGKLLDNSEIL